MILCLIALLYSAQALIGNEIGMVMVPVADIVGAPLDEKIPELGPTIVQRYLNLPYCGGTYLPGIACPRVHQLLFHEVVSIIATYEHQICISVPHIFYITHTNKQPQTIYWTLKTNILNISKLAAQNTILPYLPDPIDFNKKKIVNQQNTILLTCPWYNEKIDVTFSAGTRFVYNKDQSTASDYVAYVLNPHTTTIQMIHIPAHLCWIVQKLAPEQSIKKFVELLTSWAHTPLGFIPYVWGGCSFCAPLSQNIFHEKEQSFETKQKTSFYVRSACNNQVKSGFDCAGLVCRAAQMCAMPFFYKNTFTMAKHIPSLQKDEPVNEGDLIWIPGHIMVLANKQKNTIIEARSYASGYGVVHEIALAKVFKGITTFAQLQSAYLKKEMLYRLDSKGQEVEKINTFKILKLEKIWH